MLVQQKQSSLGHKLSGEYTIKNPKLCTTTNNQPYFIFDIKVNLVPVKVIAWKESWGNITKIWHGQNIFINGIWQQFNGLWQVKCQSIKYSNQQDQEIAKAKIRLRALLSWLPDETLKNFVVRVFNDPMLAKDFTEAPASLNHHHAFIGGLLVHSVDVAWQVFNQQRVADQERYVGMVASLFHDLGKIRTLSSSMSRSRLGTLIDHEQLTLEILAPHLQWLDTQDPGLSMTIRYLLSWKPKSFDPIPKFEVYEVIKMADRVSAGSGS